MSLRLRFSLLYTSLLGGVLLLFGGLVYGLVSIILVNQIDISLTQEAQNLISRLKATSTNQLDQNSAALYEPTQNILIQFWDTNQKLVFARPALLQTVLDSRGLHSGAPIFHSVATNEQYYLRVLSVPLSTARGAVGVLQVGMNMGLVVALQRSLAVTLALLTLAAMFLSGLVIWFVTGRALAPISALTRVATEITRADDLSRRIPTQGILNDEVGRLVVAFNDTLERLEKLFTTQSRFLADVSHELRTPLTVIKGNLSLMRRMKEVDEESMDSISHEVDRLTRLVGDLLLLAQAESGRLPLQLGKVELDGLLLDVVQQLQPLAGDRRLIVSEIDEVQMTGDGDRLRQLLINLVSNAIQYTPAGSRVFIRLSKDETFSRLEVTDTGPGIPAEDLPHIFERFYRGERSRKRSPTSGFGLGLSIAYWIVKNHDGTIEAQSEEGQGTTFIVRLPLRGPEARS
ncbi:signal transduction histidine kinase [Longilinea arvoryzae]|uniref:histidine kinase n=1 Tax=Longilinea arvoryzae TaxID=360412 RepID=A0A0S7B958_9CHLR|nr:HAMP domain-containing sensor histidine kinase [Longilinea arvoryzae]GAP13996.1 signal transduction histidine kinase [Longilinea arvoryzae]